MNSIYKFEYHSTYQVSVKSLTCTGGRNLQPESTFRHRYRSREGVTITPVPKDIKVTKAHNGSQSGTIDLTSLYYPSSELDYTKILYLHPNCTIPRAKVTAKYIRTLKADRAEICVVPKVARELETEIVAIFHNKTTGKLYYIESGSFYSNSKWTTLSPDFCSKYPLGTSVLQINPMLKGSTITELEAYGEPEGDWPFSQSNWESYLNSTLIYCGRAIKLRTNEVWIADVMYKKLHDIVSEDEILATLGDANNVLNRENYDNLKQMLNSSDQTVVGLGLKALAEMDYEKYRNTAIHLLCTVSKNWRNSDIKGSASVKYMLNFLDQWRYSRESYSQTTTQEDFDMLYEIIESDFKECTQALQQAFNERFPFAKIDFDYSFAITPRLEGDEPLQAEEEVEEDYDDDDDY